MEVQDKRIMKIGYMYKYGYWMRKNRIKFYSTKRKRKGRTYFDTALVIDKRICEKGVYTGKKHQLRMPFYSDSVRKSVMNVQSLIQMDEIFKQKVKNLLGEKLFEEFLVLDTTWGLTSKELAKLVRERHADEVKEGTATW